MPCHSGSEAGRDAVVAAAVANCEAQMDGDRKTTALKSLQVWGAGMPWGRLGLEAAVGWDALASRLLLCC